MWTAFVDLIYIGHAGLALYTCFPLFCTFHTRIVEMTTGNISCWNQPQVWIVNWFIVTFIQRNTFGQERVHTSLYAMFRKNRDGAILPIARKFFMVISICLCEYYEIGKKFFFVSSMVYRNGYNAALITQNVSHSARI